MPDSLGAGAKQPRRAAREQAFVDESSGAISRFAERFTVICEARQSEAQFPLCEKANNHRFIAAAGRAARKLGQRQKLPQRGLLTACVQQIGHFQRDV
jgi:hypothetical protein